jgi:Terminase large subunit, T4likevirus-type, N-terminal
MKLQIKYERNIHQELFHSDLATKILHLSAGFASGKSHALVMKACQLSVINKHTDGGILCPTYGDFKKDILPLFEKIFDANGIRFQYHRQDHYFKFPWNKRKLWVASAENSLRGPNWGYAVINELTLMPIYRFREVLGRVRDKHAVISQIASVGTPEGIGSEYYDFFIENPPKEFSAKVIYGSTRDNAMNLDPAYIPMLEATYDKQMLDAYLKGLWVNMNGHQFYYAYSDRNHAPIQQIDYETVHCFMDFNVEFMTATFWHKIAGELLGFDEIVIENDADTNKMVHAMLIRGYNPDNTIVYPDPAGKGRRTSGTSDHIILKQAGFEVIARLAAPRMRERQLNTNNLLDKGIVKFNHNAMPYLKRDFQAVEQDVVTYEKIKSNPKLTHASDGFDYGCDILFPMSGKRTKSDIIKLR